MGVLLATPMLVSCGDFLEELDSPVTVKLLSIERCGDGVIAEMDVQVPDITQKYKLEDVIVTDNTGKQYESTFGGRRIIIPEIDFFTPLQDVTFDIDVIVRTDMSVSSDGTIRKLKLCRNKKVDDHRNMNGVNSCDPHIRMSNVSCHRDFSGDVYLDFDITNLEDNSIFIGRIQPIFTQDERGKEYKIEYNRDLYWLFMLQQGGSRQILSYDSDKCSYIIREVDPSARSLNVYFNIAWSSHSTLANSPSNAYFLNIPIQ